MAHDDASVKDSHGASDARATVRAIATLSGGLDSILAAAIVKRAGIDVLGLHVRHLFSAHPTDGGDPIALAANAAGIPLRVLDLGEEHLEIVRHPRHGVGAGMNPCIDCRIFVLRAAKRVMDEEGGQFVITGEVLGQRPMSQHRQALDIVARESGLGERLFRPLSAALLPEALPVRQGWIRLEDLPQIHGRSRHEQLALARELGLEHVPPAAGGCLLVEKVYAARLRDAFAHVGADALSKEGFELLGVGRQFRLSERVKLIVGRDEKENDRLEEHLAGRIAIRPQDVVGPTALVEGDPDKATLALAAALVARYCDRGDRERLAMAVGAPPDECVLEVAPLAADDPRIAAWRIG